MTVRVQGAIAEVHRKRPFWDRRTRSFSLHAFRRLVALAVEDPRVTGFLVTIEGVGGGMATARSLSDALAAARRGGKRVAVYLPDGADSRELYVGCAADVLLLGPETHVGPLGFAVLTPYFGEALSKVGVEADVYARGDYKTAAEPLVRSSMSEAQREQLGVLLDTAFDELVGALAAGRRVDRATAVGWIDGGPWSAQVATNHGIVDGVAYPDQVPKKLEPKTKEGATLFAAQAYLRRRRLTFGVPWRRPHVGVVEVSGAIVSRSPTPLIQSADERSVVEALDQAREDPLVRGVIVSVDSRGGSALASGRMLHAVRRLAQEKPVVAYLGDVAASGGYMVAVGAARIVAQPTTITGSIGVVAVRPILEPVLRRFGIALEGVKRGERADLSTTPRRLTDAERSVIEAQMDDVYRSFLSAVAEGRHRPVEEVEPLAGGRVWAGRDAAKHGLVDALGGFDVALDELKKLLGGPPRDLEVRVVGSAGGESPLMSLMPSPSRSAGSAVGDLGLTARLPVALRELLAFVAGGHREVALAWCPVADPALPSPVDVRTPKTR